VLELLLLLVKLCAVLLLETLIDDRLLELLEPELLDESVLLEVLVRLTKVLLLLLELLPAKTTL
jgi:hypothetical protein